MTLQQLRDFISVVEHNGFRAAARALSVSQGALTKSVLKLESLYGVDLLLRTTAGITLTPPGRRLLAHAKSILLEVDEATTMLARKEHGERLTVVVGASIGPALALMPKVSEDFRKLNDNANVHVQYGAPGDLVNMLQEGRLNVVITEVPRGLNTRQFRVEVIYKESLFIASRADAREADVSAQALGQRPWLVLSEANGANHPQDELRDVFEQRGWTMPTSVCSSNSLIAAIDHVARTDALCLLPERIFTHPIAVKRIRKTAVSDQPVAQREVAIITRNAGKASREVAQFVSMTRSFARIKDAGMRLTA